MAFLSSKVEQLPYGTDKVSLLENARCDLKNEYFVIVNLHCLDCLGI